MFNVRVAAGPPRRRRSQLGGWGRFSRFCLKSQKSFAILSQGACWWFRDGMCKKVLLLSIYKKLQKSLQITNSLMKSQNKVWKLATCAEVLQIHSKVNTVATVMYISCDHKWPNFETKILGCFLFLSWSLFYDQYFAWAKFLIGCLFRQLYSCLFNEIRSWVI